MCVGGGEQYMMARREARSHGALWAMVTTLVLTQNEMESHGRVLSRSDMV